MLSLGLSLDGDGQHRGVSFAIASQKWLMFIVVVACVPGERERKAACAHSGWEGPEWNRRRRELSRIVMSASQNDMKGRTPVADSRWAGQAEHLRPNFGAAP